MLRGMRDPWSKIPFHTSSQVTSELSRSRRHGSLVERTLSKPNRWGMRKVIYGRLPCCAQMVMSFGQGARAVLLASVLATSHAAAQAQTVVALPTPSRALEKRGTATPLPAWIGFCKENPTECAVDPTETDMITLTPDVWRMLVSVSGSVNREIAPIIDQQRWGVADKWVFPDDGSGDCEDYQLLKRKILVDRGLPRRALRMTVVLDEQGEGHALLLVRTDRGDYVLDNKTDAVLSWQETGYVYVKRESQDRTGWVSLGGVSSPTMTAKH